MSLKIFHLLVVHRVPGDSLQLRSDQRQLLIDGCLKLHRELHRPLPVLVPYPCKSTIVSEGSPTSFGRFHPVQPFGAAFPQRLRGWAVEREGWDPFQRTNVSIAGTDVHRPVNSSRTPAARQSQCTNRCMRSGVCSSCSEHEQMQALFEQEASIWAQIATMTSDMSHTQTLQKVHARARESSTVKVERRSHVDAMKMSP